MSLTSKEQQTDDNLLTQNKKEELDAKIKELNERKSREVYTEINDQRKNKIHQD